MNTARTLVFEAQGGQRGALWGARFRAAARRCPALSLRALSTDVFGGTFGHGTL